MKNILRILLFLSVPLCAMELPEKGTKKEESEQIQLIKPTTFASYNEELQKTLLIDWNKKLFTKNDELYKKFIQQYAISKHFYKARLQTQELSRFLHGLKGKKGPWVPYLVTIYEQLLKIKKYIRKGIAQLPKNSPKAIDLLHDVNYILACVKAAIEQEQGKPIQEKKMKGKRDNIDLYF